MSLGRAALAKLYTELYRTRAVDKAVLPLYAGMGHPRSR